MSIIDGGRRNENSPQQNTTGWSFGVIFPKLILGMIVAVFCLFLFIGFVMFAIGDAFMDDPAVIGRTLGMMVQGFQETQNK